MAASIKPVTIISECSVKPVFLSEEAKKPYYLTAWDIATLSYRYIEFGLLFNKPRDQSMFTILAQLKNSLATTLTHFFPLSGRFVTQTIHDPPSYCVYVDCKDAVGARFIHAVASGVTISDILIPSVVPSEIINPMFVLPPDTINAHGHNIPLLVIQVTQLRDGIFIGFSMNHAIADGATFWHFINSYSEACRSATQQLQNHHVIPRPPVTSPWFWNGQVCIPCSHPTVQQSEALPPLIAGAYRCRVFHFTSEAIAQLKKKANDDDRTQKITSYQALVALIWRSATRARRLRGDQITTFVVPINCRTRVEPPLSNAYFGNCLTPAQVSSSVDELLSNNLGWAASKLHNEIISHDDKKVRSYLELLATPDCAVPIEDHGLFWTGFSPRFDVYGNNFGWGKPIAMRWSEELVNGYVLIMSGRDKGSIDVAMSFFSEFMNEIELDSEFMDAQSPHIRSHL